ncbi:MAG: hypothetical protein HY791_33285 [Deltaproteobacteria bacterium]|nr:hypothetical protein [Deltaproteobacteria bacterium]
MKALGQVPTVFRAAVAGLWATAFPVSGWSQELSMRLDQPLVLRRIDAFAPTVLGRIALLDQLGPSTISLIDESGGFAESDREWISVLGESAMRTRWTIEGLDVSSPMEQGASLVRLPRILTGTISIFGPESGGPSIDERATRPATFARGYAQKGSVLGMAPFARDVLATFSGKHATERGIRPSSERRYRDAFALELAHEIDLGSLPSAVGIEVRGDRRFFPGLGSGSFEDQTLAVDGALLSETESGRLRLVGSFRDRGHVSSELGRAARESATIRSLAVFSGLVRDELSVGLTLSHAAVALREPELARSIEDPDGQGLRPSVVPGAITMAVIETRVGTREGAYGELTIHGLGRSSSTKSWTESLTSLGSLYGRNELEVGSTFVSTGSARAGVRASVGGDARLDFDGYVRASYALNDSLTNTLFFPDVGLGFRGRARLFGVEGYVLGRRDPIAPSDALAQALDPSGLALTELVDTLGPTRREGGRFTVIDPAIRSPVSWIGSVGLIAGVTKSLDLELSGSIRHLEALPELVLDGPPGAFGDTIDGVFFFRPDNETRWLLRSSKRGATYLGGHFQARTRDLGNLVFALSFSAFTSVGYPPLGNGPDANDVFAPLPRDPNADLFGLASLDADRAFITKLWVAGRLFGEGPIETGQGLFLSLSLSHRDGQPFAFLDRHEYEGRVAFTLGSHRGSPLSYDRPLLGPREDFQLMADIGMSYGFEAASVPLLVSLVVSNAFDLGSEAAEGQDPDRRRERAALELGVPRALTLSLSLRK